MSSVRIALLVGSAGLLLAIAPMPNEYYRFLRFLICGICIFASYVSLRERSALAFPFLAVGVLFNPIARTHMDRQLWVVVDVIVALGFVAVARMAPRLDAARVVVFPPSDATAEAQPAESSS